MPKLSIPTVYAIFVLYTYTVSSLLFGHTIIITISVIVYTSMEIIAIKDSKRKESPLNNVLKASVRIGDNISENFL